MKILYCKLISIFLLSIFLSLSIFSQNKVVAQEYDSARERILHRASSKNQLYRVTIDEKSKLIYSAGPDVVVFDYELNPISEFNFFEGWAYAIALSDDGNILAIGTDNGTVALASAKTGEKLFDFVGHTRWISHLIFQDDKTLISSSDDGTTRVWDLESKLEKSRLRVGGSDGTYAGGDNWLAIEYDDQLKDTFELYNLQSEKFERSILNCKDVESYNCTISATDIAGSLFLEGTHSFLTLGKSHGAKRYDEKSVVNQWDINTGELIKHFASKNTPEVGARGRFDVSFDGRLLAAGGGTANSQIIIWDIQSGKQLVEFIAHSSEIKDLKFFPDDYRLVSVGERKEITIWKVDVK